MTAREYEAMFLLDNQAATADYEATAGQVDAILEKHGAELVLKEKWDERKLAYEIKGHRRATYYLVYFRAEPSAITEVDTDVHLNEVILRHLVIALEEPIDQHIESRAADREKMAEESRRASLSGWGDRRGGRDQDRDRDRRRERKPEDKPEDKPAEKPADAPAADAAPEAAPADAPAGAPADAPAEAEAPADTPADTPAEAPADAAAEAPAATPAADATKDAAPVATETAAVTSEPAPTKSETGNPESNS